MKSLFVTCVAIFLSMSAYASSGENMTITGKILSLEEKTLTLKVDDTKVQVPKKYLTHKHAVGEVVTVAFPKEEFNQLVFSKTKK